jgi:hypothetical protein
MILFWKFNDDVQSIFLDTKSTPTLSEGKKYNIILSPALYWVKKLSLPLKYAHEVKKIAPALFEEHLPDGNYSYYVYKEGDEFILFAYEDRKIIELLEQKGIALGSVKNFYFAQTALQNYDTPCKINENEVVAVQEGLVLLLPIIWYDDVKPLTLENAKLTKYAVKIEQFGHILTNTTLYKIIALLGFFAMVLLVEFFVLQEKTDQLKDEVEQVFVKNKLKPTMMQNRAILKTYKKRYVEQKKLRLSLLALLQSSLKKGEYIESVRYKDGLLKVYFNTLDASVKRRITTVLSMKNISFKSAFEKEKFVVEVKL